MLLPRKHIGINDKGELYIVPSKRGEWMKAEDADRIIAELLELSFNTNIENDNLKAEIKALKNPPKPEPLYEQLNTRAKEVLSDFEYPVVLFAYGRLNRGCYECSGSEVFGDDFCEEGVEQIYESDLGNAEFNKRKLYKKNICKCLKKRSDAQRLIEEQNVHLGDWDSVALIYWDPETKSVCIEAVNPSEWY